MPNLFDKLAEYSIMTRALQMCRIHKHWSRTINHNPVPCPSSVDLASQEMLRLYSQLEQAEQIDQIDQIDQIE